MVAVCSFMLLKSASNVWKVAVQNVVLGVMSHYKL